MLDRVLTAVALLSILWVFQAPTQQKMLMLPTPIDPRRYRHNGVQPTTLRDSNNFHYSPWPEVAALQ